MINAQYKLIRPYVVEARYCNLNVDGGEVLVRPTFLSICKADLRYFHGLRSAQTLRERLPLCLIHEAVGTVLYDPTGTFKKHTKVVCLPNIPGEDSPIRENYRLDSLFRSSRADGFMQEVLSISPSHLIAYEGMDDTMAAITELVSVGIHAATSFLADMDAHALSPRLAVWGDGAVAYCTAVALKAVLPGCHITVIGVNPSKLQYFTFADEVQLANQLDAHAQFDHCFECVGGQASAQAISQMIDSIFPEGKMILMGVSEEPVPINTRMVLEKGLTLVGRSRSGKADFQQTVDLMEMQDEFSHRISMLLSHIVQVCSINDIYEAFSLADSANFKVVMDWRV